jgi:hypothetical protein
MSTGFAPRRILLTAPAARRNCSTSIVNKNAGQQAELCWGSPIDSRFPACDAYGKQRCAREAADEYCVIRRVV